MNIGYNNPLVSQQVITRANVDPDLGDHIVSQGHNDLIICSHLSACMECRWYYWLHWLSQSLLQRTKPKWHSYLLIILFYSGQQLVRCIPTWYLNTLRRKMAAIFQTTFSNAFSSMKINEFWFHWSLVPSVQLTIFHHWFRYWLGVDQATSHYLNQWWLVYWRIYASLGLNELKQLNLIRSDLPLFLT